MGIRAQGRAPDNDTKEYQEMPSIQVTSRSWVLDAVRRIERDFQRSSDTHLLQLDLPAMPQVRLYLKD